MRESLLFGAVLVLWAPALKELPKSEPVLVGDWEVESMTVNGKPRAGGARPLRYAFTADGKWFSYRGERRPPTTERVYFTNPKAHPPTLDLKYDAADQEGTVALGIFKVEGDTLTLCMPRGSRDRPTSFVSSPDSPATLYVFRRIRPKD